MSMVRAMRMLNSIEIGTTDATALQTLLADAGRLSEWQALLSMRGQVKRMLASSTTMSAVCGSARALGALLANPTASGLLYSAEGLTGVSPSAWAVFSPRVSSFDLSGGEVMRWRNAQGNTARDLVQATSANRPLLNSINAINGMSAPVFDGSNDFLEMSEAFNQATAFTVFVVYRRGSTSNHGFFGNTEEGLGATSTQDAQASTSGGTGTFSTASGINGSWALGRYRKQSASAIYHSLNGGTDSTAISTNIPSFAAAPNYVGRAFIQSGDRYLNGRIAEMWLIAGNGDATTPELVRVTALLKTKYGL